MRATAVQPSRAVDRIHELADQAGPRPVMGLEKHSAQRRGERQRIDGGNEHRHRDGDRELAEQFAGDAGDECDRHEHREQDQRDRDDGCSDFLHRQFGRFDGGEFQMFLHHAFDILDHYDASSTTFRWRNRRAARPNWRNSRCIEHDKVPIRLTGTAIVGISVARMLRETDRRRTTRTTPRSAFPELRGWCL